ncbi:MAG: hypothetical protein IJ467_06505 [Bacteroidaceae bacterium]|nr:hypothetical protein [Bacteroidaceae bacterium]
MSRLRIQQQAARQAAIFPLSMVGMLALWIIDTMQLMGEAGNAQSTIIRFTPWVALLLQLAATWLLLELCNRYALIRVRTTFHASIYLWTVSLFPSLVCQPGILFAGLCLVVSLFYLFNCYGTTETVSSLFHLFLFLSVASMFVPPFSFYMPLVLLTLIPWNALSLRSFLAGLVGILLPWIYLTTYAVVCDDYTVIPSFFQLLIQDFCVGHSTCFTLPRILCLCFVLCLNLFGIIDFLLYRFHDKLRTRQFLQFFSWYVLLSLILLLIYPTYVDALCLLLSISGAIFSSHLFALSSYRSGSILFYTLVVILAVLVVWRICSYFFNL